MSRKCSETFARQGNSCSPLSALCPTPPLQLGCGSALPWLFKSFTLSLPQIKHKQEKEISNSPSKKHFPEARGITRFLRTRVSCSSCTLSGTWGGESTKGEEGGGGGWGWDPGVRGQRSLESPHCSAFTDGLGSALSSLYKSLLWLFCYYLRLFCKQTVNPSCKKYI